MRKPFFTAISAIFILIFVAAAGSLSWGQHHEKSTDTTHVQSHADSTVAESHGGEHEAFNANETIIEHVKDAPVWHLTDHLVIPLVVIVYSSDRGLDVFSSGHFFDEHHNEV